jgi:hypothetical protein
VGDGEGLMGEVLASWLIGSIPVFTGF